VLFRSPEDGTLAEEVSIGDRVLKRSLRRRQEYLWIDRVVPYELTSAVGKNIYFFQFPSFITHIGLPTE